MDRAIEELLRRNRCGASTIIPENAAVVRVLYTSTDFLMEVDTRLQDSLGRVLSEAGGAVMNNPVAVAERKREIGARIGDCRRLPDGKPYPRVHRPGAAL